MTSLNHGAEDFAALAIDGLVAANPILTRHSSGVVRAALPAASKVALVIGGGSGHYPAFAGLVGPGLATGAVCGNIFASPSANQVREIALACDQGAGVLLSYGNYAGDVLHFGQAERRLRDEGIDVETVVVTDDIASANATDGAGRGIAGDLVVFKIAGAAAEAGLALADVARVARHANSRTVSLGVAFAGCTLPGATEPLFTVPAGRVSIGLGIHGEPGIDEIDLPTASELAELLVAKLLAARPEGATERVVPILNGLGTVKYEELFVLYSHIHRLLAAEGLEIFEPEVGELVTSLDMAGLSLTLMWPDAELSTYWSAPAQSAAYQKAGTPTAAATSSDAPVRSQLQMPAPAERVVDSRRYEWSEPAVRALVAIRDALDGAAAELGRIDAIAGDGDHGIGMQRGSKGAVIEAERALASGAGIGQVLAAAGDGWSDHGGGTSGALWGEALRSFGASLAEADPDDSLCLAAAVTAGLEAVQAAGGAVVGDKTMIDAFAPFASSLRFELEGGATLQEAWGCAATVAVAAAQATESLRPRLGRARPLAERSIGHPDAGAVSFGIVVTTLCSPAMFPMSLAQDPSEIASRSTR